MDQISQLKPVKAASRPQAGPKPWLGAVFLSLIAVALLAGGLKLVKLGGSPYYVLAGVWLGLTAFALIRRPATGYACYAVFLVATLVWGVAETGWDFWGLTARVLAPAIVGVGLSIAPISRRFGVRSVAAGLLIAAGALVVAYVGARHVPSPKMLPGAAPNAGEAPDWTTVSGDGRGARYSPLKQISPTTLKSLRLVWTYRTGDLPRPTDGTTLWTMEATPIQVGRTLYFCTAHSQVHAIDAETGQPRWMFDPRSVNGWASLRACRGVAYFKAPGGVGDCPERIISPVGDGRLIALDAHTGRLCRSFGEGGRVNLLEGLGLVRPGYYFMSSNPAIIDGKVIVNADIMDGSEVNEPSGVIRAYDATTGQLAWAWDMGAPNRTGSPGPGQTYTRGTPSSWPPMSVDEGLNQLYVPLGNTTPDFFGGGRRPETERYRDALVALDAHTGKIRWSFQTTRHDLWDHDLPAQPTLFELPTEKGAIPALIQPTKRGELYVLDRRTGKPLTRVVDRAAPGGALPGDFTAPTQPYSDGMPSFAGPDLSEARMWGMTPLDQLWCRIRFHELRYEGQFTPPSVRGSLVYPANAGLFSWGGVAIDPVRKLLIANTTHTPFVSTAIPRAQADRMGLDRPINSPRVPAKGPRTESAYGYPQVGAPYAATTLPFLSPLSVPCMAPPWGRISAIDLNSRKLLWSKPFGTSTDTGPFGSHFGPPLTIGVPNAGGAVALASGIFFIAGSQDQYLRAFASETGRELWRARLPAGGQSSPMTYRAPDGRQFVVIVAGGHQGLNTRVGDFVLGYALK